VDALEKKEKTFEVNDEKTSQLGWSQIQSFKELTSESLYHSKTTYHLWPEVQYISLDSNQHSDLKIRSVNKDVIVHCSQGGADAVKVGDFIVGSSEGSFWTHEDVDVNWRAQSSSSIKGLVLTRKVESIAPSSIENCFNVKTSQVHPIELFHSFHVEAETHRPYDISYNLQRRTRKLQTTPFAKPDKPAVLCDDAAFKDNWSTDPQSFSDPNFEYNLGGVNGCAFYNYAIPGSINFNYNVETHSADVPSIPLRSEAIDGVSCNDCYIFMGANVFAIIDYFGTGSTIDFEAKLAGGIGVNVNMELDNPSVQGAQTFQLVAASGEATKFKLGNSGLTGSFQNGGLTATVSGSGSSSFSAKAGGGASTSAYLEIMYATQNPLPWSFPNDINWQVTAPYMGYSNFQINQVTITTVLNGIEKFTLEYNWLGVWWIGADFTINYGATVSYEYGGGAQANSQSLSVSLGSPLTGHIKTVYGPGDEVPVIVNYKGFAPGKPFHLYYSLQGVLAAPQGLSIMHQVYTASHTGAGAITTSWIVPWDHYLTDSITSEPTKHITVRSSSTGPGRVAVSDTAFKIEMRNNNVLVTSPKYGSDVPLHGMFSVKWDKSLLSHFASIPGAGGLGQSIEDSLVTILAVPVSSANLDAFLQTGSSNEVKGVALVENVANTGSAVVAFPATDVFKESDAVVIFVKSSKYSNIFGWSGVLKISATFGSGTPINGQDEPQTDFYDDANGDDDSVDDTAYYGNIENGGNSVESDPEDPSFWDAAMNPSHFHFGNSSGNFTDDYISGNTTDDDASATDKSEFSMMALPEPQRRSAMSVCNWGTVTLSINVEGSFDDFFLSGKRIPIGVSTGSRTLYGPVSACVHADGHGPDMIEMADSSTIGTATTTEASSVTSSSKIALSSAMIAIITICAIVVAMLGVVFVVLYRNRKSIHVEGRVSEVAMTPIVTTNPLNSTSTSTV